MSHLKSPVLAISLIALAACGRTADEAPAPDASPTANAPAASTQAGADIAAVGAALANPNRLAGDREEDARRKAADVLKFLELQPGMRALDYFAGGGYYTELMSSIVGPNGHVIAYNNAPYLKYAGDKPAQRYGENRLANVAQLTTAPEDLPLDPDSLDAVLFVQSYHDLYWRSKDSSWPATDPKKSLAKLAPALKSGAVVVVIDHVAESGADPAVTVDTLHRIDPAVVRRDFEAAGLVLDAESPLFKNPADDHTNEVFDPAIRHKTDQIMYRFRKP